MNRHIDKAMQLRNETPMVSNCAQTIMRAYADELGMTEQQSATPRQRKQGFQMSSVLQKKFTLSIPKERRTSNDNNKIQRQTHPNPYINPNHHLPHHPQLQPDPCSSRTQRGHNPERVLPNHNPVT